MSTSRPSATGCTDSLWPPGLSILYKVLLLVYKALHNAVPDYLSDLLQHRQIRAGLRSSDEIQLVEPVFCLKNYGHRSFSSVGPSYWNSLPSAVSSGSLGRRF